MSNKKTKEVVIANFNCTFGEKDKPMLDYFDNIIYPAFKSGIVREINKDTSYLFSDVKLIECAPDDFALVGNFIKTTKLEVRNNFIEGKGLTYTNLILPTSPYSIFIIFLKNHRMVYYKNQKGSPMLSAFAGTAKYILQQYIVSENKKSEDKLPFPSLKVIPVPEELAILDQLRRFEKIKYVDLSLFPVNGDAGISDAFDILRSEINAMDSKTSHLKISSPKNHIKVASFLSNTYGTVSPTIKGQDSKGGTIIVKPNFLTENIPIQISEELEADQKTNDIIKLVQNHPILTKTTDDNSSIYMRKLDIIKSFFK